MTNSIDTSLSAIRENPSRFKEILQADYNYVLHKLSAQEYQSKSENTRVCLLESRSPVYPLKKTLRCAVGHLVDEEVLEQCRANNSLGLSVHDLQDYYDLYVENDPETQKLLDEYFFFLIYLLKIHDNSQNWNGEGYVKRNKDETLIEQVYSLRSPWEEN
jgi:hypothetical protein